MSMLLGDRARRKRQERRIFLITLLIFVGVFASTFAYFYGAAYRAYWTYSPAEGDVVFQSLPRSPIVNAIEGASHSPLSHCGVVSRVNGKWVVFEAYDGVESTPLREFVFRGRGYGFAVYRLRPPHRAAIPKMVQSIQSYLGRPYDTRYRMDDEKIYCSELIYKAFQKATGQRLGQLVRLDELEWQPYVATIRRIEGGAVPLDRELIAPRDLAKAEQLECVFAFNIAISTPLVDSSPGN